MRDNRVPLLFAAITFLSIGLWLRADSKPKYEATPKVINERGDKMADRLTAQADTMNNLYFQKKWTEEEWKDLLYDNQMILNKIESAFFEVLLCKSKSQGYYCEQSSRDLDEAEYELDKLDKEITRVGQVSL
jgi:hypothetical protein